MPLVFSGSVLRELESFVDPCGLLPLISSVRVRPFVRVNCPFVFVVRCPSLVQCLPRARVLVVLSGIRASPFPCRELTLVAEVAEVSREF